MDPTFQTLMAALSAVPVLGPVLPYVPLACFVASILDAAIPQPAPGSVWAAPRSVLHVMSLGIGFARPGVPGVPAAVVAKANEVQAIASQVSAAAGELAGAAATPAPAAPASSIARTVTAMVLAFLISSLLSACTSAQVRFAVAQGQLVCAIGPTFVALADPTGAAVLAQGATKAFVDAACAAVNGIAVPPPDAPVPVVKVVPPAVAAPLEAGQ